MIRKRWKLTVGLMVLVLALTSLAVIPAMADDSGGTAIPASPQLGERCQDFMAKVAANLGVSVEDLQTAVRNAKEAMVDEALTNGKLTQEQANQIKQHIEENGGLCSCLKHRPQPGHRMMGMLDRAVEQGIITQEQADAVKSVFEDIKAYVKENGRPDVRGEILNKAVENGIITQDQADEVRSILDSIREYVQENGLSGFHQHGPRGGHGPMGMGNSSFHGFQGLGGFPGEN